MTDPLGQSQVIPYLIGLSEKGYTFHLISFEKKENFIARNKILRQKLDNNAIVWHPLSYTKYPPVISSLWDLLKAYIKTISISHRQTSFRSIISLIFPFVRKSINEELIIHCRSYVPSLIGLWMKKQLTSGTSGRKNKIKFIFDMRGFWADERAEGKIWNLKNPLYNTIYKYFKKKENLFLSHADHTIILTENGKNIIMNDFQKSIPISVIPCCADTNHFIDNYSVSYKNSLKAKLGIVNSDFVLTYLGSIGTWYLLDEMLDFYSCLLEIKKNSRFLFLTPENAKTIWRIAKAKNIPEEKIIIRQVSYNDIPGYISLSTLAIFFIRPSFSKRASSPTKLGEIFSMGIPLVCNSGIGDVDQIIKDSKAGLIIDRLEKSEYLKVIKQLDQLTVLDKNEIRKYALTSLSLNKGILDYLSIYSKIIS